LCCDRIIAISHIAISHTVTPINMKALEVTGTIDRQGHLLLDQPLDVNISDQESHRVRVIVLFSEAIVLPQELEDDPDDTPINIEL